VSGEEPPATPADLARTLREAADRLMSGWTAALTGSATPEPAVADPGATGGSHGGSSDAGGTSASVWPGGTGVPGLPALSTVLGPLTPPATLSARQLQAVLDDLAARRAQVQALQASLGLFDEQLAALETSLAPVLEWTRAWAGMEQAMTGFWRPPSP
jgi:hypothetical protein